jgi:glycosyltransferase involved in cell wall biosynthesis
VPEPLVSIIIPLYNSALHLHETIESVINQTWPNKELILIDDGSSDNSLNIARQYQNDWVKVYSQANQGASAARNKGLQYAKGDCIQFLDADDLLSSNKIAEQVNLLKTHPNKIALCRMVHFFEGTDPYDANNRGDEIIFSETDSPVQFLTGLWGGLEHDAAMVTVHSWLTPRHIIEKAGPWNEGLSVDDDGEYFCRVILNSKGVIKSAGTSYYRKYKHQKSLSAKKNSDSINQQLKAIDLKYANVKSLASNPSINKAFARQYWWLGVAAYPDFKDVSRTCVQKARELKYDGPKYVGGPKGHFLTKIFGWKAARRITQSLSKK